MPISIWIVSWGNMNTAARSRREDGFTLVELLVVLLIISLMVSVIAFRPGTGPGAAERHAHEVARMLHMLSRESIVSGQPTGLDISQRVYTMKRWREGQWEPFSFERHRVADNVPEELSLMLPVTGSAPVPASSDPEVIFLPVGEATPYHLEVSSQDGNTWGVSVGAGGHVEVERAVRP